MLKRKLKNQNQSGLSSNDIDEDYLIDKNYNKIKQRKKNKISLNRNDYEDSSIFSGYKQALYKNIEFLQEDDIQKLKNENKTKKMDENNNKTLNDDNQDFINKNFNIIEEDNIDEDDSKNKNTNNNNISKNNNKRNDSSKYEKGKKESDAANEQITSIKDSDDYKEDKKDNDLDDSKSKLVDDNKGNEKYKIHVKFLQIFIN